MSNAPKAATPVKSEVPNIPFTPEKPSSPVNFEESEGKGFEGVGIEDRQIPYLIILQDMSPQVKKSSPEYIDGAEPGMIYNSITKEVFDARQSVKGFVEIIPVGFLKKWVEWKPNRGGLVRAHDSEEILNQTTKGGPRGNDDILPNRNEIIFTAYWSVLVLSLGGGITPAIFPLKKTGLKHSKKWATLLSLQYGVRANGTKYKLPLFASKWKLSTFVEGKDKETWYAPTFVEGELIQSLDLFNEAKQFHLAVAAAPALPAHEPGEQNTPY